MKDGEEHHRGNDRVEHRQGSHEHDRGAGTLAEQMVKALGMHVIIQRVDELSIS